VTTPVPRTGREPLSRAVVAPAVIPGMQGVITSLEGALGHAATSFETLAAKTWDSAKRLGPDADKLSHDAFRSIRSASPVVHRSNPRVVLDQTQDFEQAPTNRPPLASDESGVRPNPQRGGPHLVDPVVSEPTAPTRRPPAPGALHPGLVSSLEQIRQRTVAEPAPPTPLVFEPNAAPDKHRNDFIHRLEAGGNLGGQGSGLLGGNLGSSLKSIGAQVGLMADEALSKRILATPAAAFSRKTDVNGVKHWVDKNDQHVADVAPDGKAVNGRADEVNKFLRNTSSAGRLAAGLASKGGGSLLGGVLDTVGPVAGVAGVAATLGYQGIKFVQQQREANRQYQQISGGTNIDGLRARMGEYGFDARNMLTMGSGQASALYQGVSQLGVTGNTRDQALNFATDNFRKTGLDVATSMDLINTSVKHGNTNFVALAQGLKEVGDAAKNAGTNVGDAAKVYASNLQNVQSNVTQGGASAGITADFTAATTALGNKAAGLNLTGLVDPSMAYTGAALLQQSGDPKYGKMDATTIQNQLAAGGTGSRPLAAAMGDAEMQQVLKAVPQSALDSIKSQAAALQAKNPQGKLTFDDFTSITEKAFADNHVDLNGVISMANEYIPGAGANASNIQGLFGGIATKGISLSKQVDDSLNPTGISDTSKIGGQSILKGGKTENATQIDSTTDSGFGGGSSDLAQQNVDLLTSKDNGLGYNTSVQSTDGGITTTGVDYGGKDQKVFQQYLQSVHDTGQRNQAVETLLKSGAADYSGSQFIVKTKQGDKQVGLKDLVGTYGDQVAAGDVTIASGQGQGSTLSSITGITQGTGSHSAGQDAVSGAKDVQAATGSVTIDLSDWAKKTLSISTTGNAIDNTRNTGQPTPSNPGTYNLPNASGR
jgi:hypothetical protein